MVPGRDVRMEAGEIFSCRMAGLRTSGCAAVRQLRSVHTWESSLEPAVNQQVYRQIDATAQITATMKASPSSMRSGSR